MADVTMTGGCQCGRVRYTVAVHDDEAYLCHCRMCQKATGGFAAAFKNVRQTEVTWEREPDRYASSPIAKRGFCSACGTPLTFQFDEGSEMLDLTVGSFDDPSRLRPTSHFSAENAHEAWLDTKDLPRMRTEEHQPLVDRWMKTLGHLPD
ncbi:MAG: GFA family protein [Pseudomonadota bacterium]|nr:GFA family protein [Pseudomonadota bacterium]